MHLLLFLFPSTIAFTCFDISMATYGPLFLTLFQGYSLDIILKMRTLAAPAHAEGDNQSLTKKPIISHLQGFAVLAILIVTIYSNSLHAQWQFDDEPNILRNKALHLEEISAENVWVTFFSNKGRDDRLFRPLPNLTFALNWYFGRQDPFGYHLINIVIHILAAWVLYLLCHKVLSSICQPDPSEENGHRSIALLAAILWAINPIQTQAVTYIVQRMASMATLFYLLGMLYYVKARTTRVSLKRWRYFGFCLIWFLFGIGSKENAAFLPFSLLLIEWVVFRKAHNDFIFKNKAWFLLVCGVLVAVLAAILSEGSLIEYIREKYNNRPFTLEDRLMTQPRIVAGYITQILYPLPQRLSFAHDVTISTSLWHPWQTMPAIALIFSLIVGAFILSKRMPLVSLAILFFFLNHIVESTIWPLELVFEHRNYLPSLFLFLPVASGWFWLIKKTRLKNKLMSTTIASVLFMVIVLLSVGTYHRNKAWATETTLWADAVSKAPLNYRATFYLALNMAWNDQPSEAKYRYALALFKRCLTLTSQSVNESDINRATIFGNIGSIHFRMGDNKRAIANFQEALDCYPGFGRIRYDMIKALVKSGNVEEALNHSDILLSQYPDNPDYRKLDDLIRIWRKKHEPAVNEQ